MTDLERMQGLFIGQLDDYEQWLLDHAVRDGMARLVYEGGAGFMGLAKIEIVRKVVPPKRRP